MGAADVLSHARAETYLRCSTMFVAMLAEREKKQRIMATEASTAKKSCEGRGAAKVVRE